jgi:glycerophosphoryl diester phosphodiesterase
MRNTERVLGIVTGLAVAALSAFTAPAAQAAQSIAQDNRLHSTVQVIAHRGSSGAAPENTLAAVELALQQKADVVENDIQRTADGALVIVHDTTLARTTDVEAVFPDRAPWNVRDFTLAEIQQLDAGSWFAPEFAGQRVPTLAEWAHAVGRQSGMLLEVKSPDLYPGIEFDVDRELRALPEFTQALRHGRVMMQSFNHEWLRAYDAVAVDVPVGLLFAGGPPSESQLADAATWAQAANPALGDMTQDTVALIHAYGLKTYTWTVNGGQDMRRAINWGVDGVITNYPQVLRNIL